ncbi:MAG: FHA domain-containing protein [Lachnospiraceae bacterium]|nr:FHA domain-containing protein [Lachnospiraceae bacterium]
MKKVSFRVRNFEKEQFLTYNIHDEAILDEEVLDFLEDEEPKGIVPIIYDEEEEYDTFSYEVTDKICLSELSKQDINAEMVLKVMRGLVLSLIDMGEYRIPLSYLVLNRNYIYVNSNYEVEFICIPLEEMQEVVDLNAFLRNFVANLRFEPSENGDYVARMLTYINNTAIFNLRNMLTLVEDLMDVCGVEIPEDTSADIYVDYQEIDEDEEVVEEAIAEDVEGEEVAEEAIAEDVEGEEVAEEAIAEDVEGEEVAEEAIAEDVEDEEVAEEAIAEDVEDEEVVEEAIAEDVEDEEVAEEAIAEDVEDEEVAEEAIAEDVEGEEVAEEAIAEDVEDEEVAEEAIAEDVEGEEVVEEAIAEDVEDEEVVEEAIAEDVEDEEVAEEAITEDVEGEEVVEEAIAEDVESTQEVDVRENNACEELQAEKPEEVVQDNEVIEEIKEVQKTIKKPTLKTKEIPNTPMMYGDDLDEILAEMEQESNKVQGTKSGLKIKRDIKVNRASIVMSNQEESKETEELVEAPKEEIAESVQNQVPPKKKTDVPKVNPYLIRVNTKERIMITKQNFKVGKASMGVDYRVQGNGAVSRVHAIITNKDDIYYIRDNKSTNHTMVNGKVLEDGENEALVDECIILLGDEEFVFKMG